MPATCACRDWTPLLHANVCLLRWILFWELCNRFPFGLLIWWDLSAVSLGVVRQGIKNSPWLLMLAFKNICQSKAEIYLEDKAVIKAKTLAVWRKPGVSLASPPASTGMQPVSPQTCCDRDCAGFGVTSPTQHKLLLLLCPPVLRQWEREDQCPQAPNSVAFDSKIWEVSWLAWPVPSCVPASCAWREGMGLWGRICTTDSSSVVQGIWNDVSAGVDAVSALQGHSPGGSWLCLWLLISLLLSGCQEEGVCQASPSPQLRFLFEFCWKCGRGRSEWGSPELHWCTQLTLLPVGNGQGVCPPSVEQQMEAEGQGLLKCHWVHRLGSLIYPDSKKKLLGGFASAGPAPRGADSAWGKSKAWVNGLHNWSLQELTLFSKCNWCCGVWNNTLLIYGWEQLTEQGASYTQTLWVIYFLFTFLCARI